MVTTLLVFYSTLPKGFDSQISNLIEQIRGYTKDWFETNLKNRHQIVKIGDTLSDKMQIVCGVPQGNILGPILFLLYINDIKNSSKILNFSYMQMIQVLFS